jgi:aryl-alcohol dehydrogenase-like predicted oxidoreductase
MMIYGNDSDRPWVLDGAATEPIVRRALEGGITFFDAADLCSAAASTGPMTPGPNGRGLSRKHVLAAVEAALEPLGMDYVDVYQIHRCDRETPIEETMEALHDIVCAGKARYIGASSMPAEEMLSNANITRLEEPHVAHPVLGHG